jgi:diaminohydroxyphosphoribosylaminopyrimidine deaminase/5-amino-6-(5-phosphoribosylamino)uracil reductase
MTLAPSPRGIDALWPQCLEIARLRRCGAHAGTWRTNPVISDIAWEASAGCTLNGHWDVQAQDLFTLLKPLLDRQPDDRPWVIGQLGQSLDACVATHAGDSYFVTGPESLLHLHRLRALCDAVLVGAGTVAADNPRLTTRRVPGANPLRVVLDPSLRTSPDAHVFTDGQAPTVLVCDGRRHAEAADRVGSEQVLAVPGLTDAQGAVDLGVLVRALEERGTRLLFVEGGGITVSRFLAQGQLNRLHLVVAPVVIGQGRPGLRWQGADRMKDCLRPPCQIIRMGDDVLWDLDLGKDGNFREAPEAPSLTG